MRVATSWPMSPALSPSARPKSSANSDTERSQKIVSVNFSAALLLGVQVQRLVVAALGLPLVDHLLRDALAADVQARHVVGRVDGEEQEEGRQVDAEQDQHAVGDAAQDVAAPIRQMTSPRAFSALAPAQAAPPTQTSASSAARDDAASATTPAGSTAASLRTPLGDVQAQVAAVVADQDRRLGVVHPATARRADEYGKKPKLHGASSLHDLDHLVDHRLLLRARRRAVFICANSLSYSGFS